MVQEKNASKGGYYNNHKRKHEVELAMPLKSKHKDVLENQQLELVGLE